MRNISIILLLSFVAFSPAFSAAKEIPFTLDDRDRLIRLEEQIKLNRDKISSLRNEMNARLDSHEKTMENMQRQINDLKTLFYTGFGILITLVLFNLGYTIWDRRTSLYPLKENDRNQQEEINRIKTVLKELAKEDSRIDDLLKKTAIF